MEYSRLRPDQPPFDRSHSSSVSSLHHPDAQQSSTQPKHQFELPIYKEEPESLDPVLKYRRRTFWILIFYVPLLILPWVFKCILAVQRIEGGAYVVHSGLSPERVRGIARWNTAANVLGTINGVASIPLMSALVAQAAVVHCQRRKLDQKLNLRQTIALANRAWSDITILWNARATGASSRFLWLAVAFIAISKYGPPCQKMYINFQAGAIQQPLQSIVVSYTTVATVTCLDVPQDGCYFMPWVGPSTQGLDPKPAMMAGLPQNTVVQAVSAYINSHSQVGMDQYMWAEYSQRSGERRKIPGDQEPYRRQTLFYYADPNLHSNETFFTAALPVGTETGVLRHHAMRFNSTIKCETVPSSRFPSNCPGARPFTAAFERPRLLDVKVCVPGEYGASPWTLSRNRQDIIEEIFLNLTSTRELSARETNFTLHCTTSTTRGYFELGNQHNDLQYGPLKEQWPSSEDLKQNFNDEDPSKQ